MNSVNFSRRGCPFCLGATFPSMSASSSSTSPPSTGDLRSSFTSPCFEVDGVEEAGLQETLSEKRETLHAYFLLLTIFSTYVVNMLMFCLIFSLIFVHTLFISNFNQIPLLHKKKHNYEPRIYETKIKYGVVSLQI